MRTELSIFLGDNFHEKERTWMKRSAILIKVVTVESDSSQFSVETMEFS